MRTRGNVGCLEALKDHTLPGMKSPCHVIILKNIRAVYPQVLAFGRSSNAGPVGNPTDLTERLRESFYSGIAEKKEKSDSPHLSCKLGSQDRRSALSMNENSETNQV